MGEDDLADVRREIGCDIAGLANVITADGQGLVDATLVDLTREWRTVRELCSHRRWARDRLARYSLHHPADPLVLPPPDAGSAVEVDAARVVAVVRSLPPLPRAALALTMIDELDDAAVARALGRSSAKVRAALAEAQTLVAEWLPEPIAVPAAPDIADGATDEPHAEPEAERDAVLVPADAFVPPWRRPTS